MSTVKESVKGMHSQQMESLRTFFKSIMDKKIAERKTELDLKILNINNNYNATIQRINDAETAEIMAVKAKYDRVRAKANTDKDGQIKLQRTEMEQQVGRDLAAYSPYLREMQKAAEVLECVAD
jgi:hypothetical protein